ncbi:TLDc domain-containing protein [Entamoeba marina]
MFTVTNHNINDEIQEKTIHELEIDNCIKKLSDWSCLKDISILFDSDINGYSKDAFNQAVSYKQQLYFISIDEENNNIFGGYIKETIIPNRLTTDLNSYVFSLIKDDQINRNQFFIKRNWEKFAFQLTNLEPNEMYRFGRFDINVYNSSTPSSYCHPWFFVYGDVDDPLINKEIKKFTVHRIVVLQVE